jgi:hypothetical protein
MIQVLEYFIMDLERGAKAYIDFVLYITTCIFLQVRMLLFFLLIFMIFLKNWRPISGLWNQKLL